MDVPDVCPGNTVYLPVWNEGALFYTGDTHARQGQGELCGVALEITSKVTVVFDVIKERAILWPRIESPTRLMTVGSARPMEDAARIAYAELAAWLAADYGWTLPNAYQLLTQAGGLYVVGTERHESRRILLVALIPVTRLIVGTSIGAVNGAVVRRAP